MPGRSACVPEGTLFAPYKIYEIWYEATGSRVIGVGFAAVRDLVSFLRHERADRDGTANPLIAGASSDEGSGHRRMRWPSECRKAAAFCAIFSNSA